jgi:hypothetical protein
MVSLIGEHLSASLSARLGLLLSICNHGVHPLGRGCKGTAALNVLGEQCSAHE